MKYLKLFKESTNDLECVRISIFEYNTYCIDSLIKEMNNSEIEEAKNQVIKIEEFLGREFISDRWKGKENYTRPKCGYSSFTPIYGGGKTDARYIFFKSEDEWILVNIFLDHYSHKKVDILVYRTHFTFKCDQEWGLSKLSELFIDELKSNHTTNIYNCY